MHHRFFKPELIGILGGLITLLTPIMSAFGQSRQYSAIPTPPSGYSAVVNGFSHLVSRPATALAEPKASAVSNSYIELQQIIRQALDELDPAQLPDPIAAKKKLQLAIERLQRYVQIDSENGQAWSRFLRLPEIEEEIAKPQPNSTLLTELAMNMRQNYLGLEMGPFIELRNALDDMVRAAKYGTSAERTMQILTRRMEDLVGSLESPPGGAESELSADVGLVANYLVESGQAPIAVDKLRQQFRRPNVQLVARETMLNRLVGRPVAEPGPVDECILGTRILGRACLTGNVLVDLLPMSGGVALNLQLTGNLTSNNRGYNRGVVLRTTGTSPVVATKQIIATTNQLTAMPATVATHLRTRINQIEHRLRIVRKIAKRKAAEQKPKADAIAEARMRRRLGSQYDEQVDGQLVEANSQLTKLRQGSPELKRLDVPMPMLAVYSTSETVDANVVQAASFQLAARKVCPIPRPVDADAVVEVHQSAAINGIESFLAGRKIRSTDIKALAKQLLGEVPPELLEEAEGPPWEITMAPFNPVQLEFDNDQVRVTVRISRMEGNERSIPGGATIAATYTPSYRDRVLALRRDGDLEIEVPGVRSATQATTLRSVVRKKFDEILKEEIVTERLNVGEKFPRLAQFDIRRVKLDDGWLQLGIR